MNKELILEGNKLIAEFEGIKWETNWFVYPNIYPYCYTKGYKPTSNVNKTKRVCIPDLLYHLRWDWLMPVCERILDIDNCADIEFSRELDRSDLEILHGTSILCNKEGVYARVLTFVKWYAKLSEPKVD